MFGEVNKEQMSSTREDKIWADEFNRQAVVLDGRVGLARRVIINPSDQKRWLKSGYLTHYSCFETDEKDAYGLCVVCFKSHSLMKDFVGYRERHRIRMASLEECEKARASGVLPTFYESF